MIKTAMILAAGLGSRMGHLTQHTPKPLLRIGHTPLLIWHLQQLQHIGVQRVVINVAYQAQQIITTVKDHAFSDMTIVFSQEVIGQLHTGGGLLHARLHLGNEPFFLISADTLYTHNLSEMTLSDTSQAMLVMHPLNNGDQADFYLHHGQLRHDAQGTACTFAGVAIIRPQLLAPYPVKQCALGHLLHDWLAAQHVLTGQWAQDDFFNLNTPADLERIRHNTGLREALGL